MTKEDIKRVLIRNKRILKKYKVNKIGIFGELHPKTIVNFELEHPIISFEIIVDLIKQ